MASRKLNFCHLTMLIIFLVCIQLTIGQSDVTENTWKTNCFGNSQTGQCKDSLIKICSDYYMCDMVIETSVPPKRIGYVNGKVLVAIESQTYFVSNSTLNPVLTRRIIPPWDEFVDKLDNRYYAADGTTYMSQSDSHKEVEILTTGKHSFNQLAFDFENGKLFILAFHSSDERSGSLFAIKTESLNILNDKVQAERIEEAGDQITAMAVEGGLDKLLLGMKTTAGGKVVRITKQEGNPCTESVFGKKAIENIIRETQEKLLKVFTNNISQSPKGNFLFASDTDVRSLEIDNVRLKKDLRIATIRLNSFTSKLFNFNQNLKSIRITVTTESSFYPNGLPHTTSLHEHQTFTYQPSGPSGFPSFPGPSGFPGFPGPPGPPGILDPRRTTSSTTPSYPSSPPTTTQGYFQPTDCGCGFDDCVPLKAYNELVKKLEELSFGVDSILAESN